MTCDEEKADAEADEVMMNPDRAVAHGEGGGRSQGDVGEDVMDAVFGKNPAPISGSEKRSGLSLYPAFGLWDVKIDGKIRKIPYVGIRGKF